MKMDKEIERKEMLKNKGYFTVDKLLEKLQALKEKGLGDELVGSDLEHYHICEYDDVLKCVIVE